MFDTILRVAVAVLKATIIVAAIVALVMSVQLAWVFPIPFLVVGGILFGLILSLLVFGLLTPLFIKQLVNGQEVGKQSGFHLFTYIQEGQVKIIVRGDKVIRMIMLFGGHRFARDSHNPDASREHAEYWTVEPGTGSEDPLEGIAWFLYPWAKYVYEMTGAVFTGIYPFQTVYEYTLERTKIHRHEDAEDEKGRKRDNLTLEVVEDTSDHFRVREFLYPFRVPAADTQDKVPLNILAVLKARVMNPFRSAYGTDRWDLQTVNLATNAVTNFARSHTFEQTLAATSTDQAKQLNIAVQEIQGEEEKYGIDIRGVDLIDLSPVLNDEDKSKLYAEVLAKSLGKATVIDGTARANALRELNKAVDEGGSNSVEALRTEALVRAAEAAKGGTIILGAGAAGGTESQTLAAILAELKKQTGQNQNNGSNP